MYAQGDNSGFLATFCLIVSRTLTLCKLYVWRKHEFRFHRRLVCEIFFVSINIQGFFWAEVNMGEEWEQESCMRSSVIRQSAQLQLHVRFDLE